AIHLTDTQVNQETDRSVRVSNTKFVENDDYYINSKAVCHEISGKFMHLDFPRQYNNAGNLAFLYSPSEIYVGVVYAFSLYHLVKIDDPYSPFPVTVTQLSKGKITEVNV